MSPQALDYRDRKWCRFRNTPCTKVSKVEPIGVCSLGAGGKVTVVCPFRFSESDRVFKDAATLAFGEGSDIVVLPEYKLLKVMDAESDRIRKIGKVDFILGKLHNEQIIDFAALEIQAVYSSGGGVGAAFKHYLKTLNAGNEGDLRVDFRSSAQKRLVPQLRLKVPIFSRWGKKFFVAIDGTFFSALPNFATTTPGNSELTWLSYPIAKADSGGLRFDTPTIHHTKWSTVEFALEEGEPPDGPEEVIGDLQARIAGNGKQKYKVLKS